MNIGQFCELRKPEAAERPNLPGYTPVNSIFVSYILLWLRWPSYFSVIKEELTQNVPPAILAKGLPQTLALYILKGRTYILDNCWRY